MIFKILSIFLKIHPKGVHRSANKMTDGDFWIFDFFAVFKGVKVSFFDVFRKTGHFLTENGPQNKKKQKKSKIGFSHLVDTIVKLFDTNF